MRLDRPKLPLEETGGILGCVYDVQKDLFQKGKDSLIPSCGEHPLREPPESDNLARFHHTQQTSTRPLVSPPDRLSGIEQQIISTIKTFRKGNKKQNEM
jgi:hypothetical protein